VREGDAGERTGVVDEVPGREVVRPVDDEVVAGDELLDVVGGDPHFVFSHVDVRVELRDEVGGGVDLLAPHVVVPVDDLSLEVRQLHLVVVGDPDGADAGGREVLDDRRTEPARAEHEHLGVEQGLLALGAHVVHDDVSGVAVELGGIEVEIAHCRPLPPGTHKPAVHRRYCCRLRRCERGARPADPFICHRPDDGDTRTDPFIASQNAY